VALLRTAGGGTKLLIKEIAGWVVGQLAYENPRAAGLGHKKRCRRRDQYKKTSIATDSEKPPWPLKDLGNSRQSEAAA